MPPLANLLPHSCIGDHRGRAWTPLNHYWLLQYKRVSTSKQPSTLVIKGSFTVVTVFWRKITEVPTGDMTYQSSKVGNHCLTKWRMKRRLVLLPVSDMWIKPSLPLGIHLQQTLMTTSLLKSLTLLYPTSWSVLVKRRHHLLQMNISQRRDITHLGTIVLQPVMKPC